MKSTSMNQSMNKSERLSETPQPQTSERNSLLAICLGGMTIFIGFLAIIGWHTHTISLIQVLPSFPPMQYNTGLGFIFAGAGLIFLSRGNKTACVWLGLFVFIWGALVLGEYITHIDLGIDQLFMKAYILTKVSSPGRMAPNTAFCFCLTGFILLLYALIKQNWRLNWIYYLALFLVANVTSALAGYIFQIEASYGWGSLTRMPVITVLAFLMLGIGFIFSVRRKQKIYWFSSSVFVLGILLSLQMLQVLTKHEDERTKQGFRDSARAYVQAIRKEVAEIESILSAISGFYEGSRSIERDEYHSFSERVYANNTAIQGIDWMPRVKLEDKNVFENKIRLEGIKDFKIKEKESSLGFKSAGERAEYFPVTYSEPIEQNRSAFGFDHGSEAVRLDAILESEKLNKPIATAPMRLFRETQENWKGIILFYPVFGTERPTGKLEVRDTAQSFLAAVVRIPKLIDTAKSHMVNSQELLFSINDMTSGSAENLFKSPGLGSPESVKALADLGYSYVSAFDFAGRKYEMILTPSPTYLTEHQSWFPWIAFILILMFVLVISGFLSKVIDSSEKARRAGEDAMEASRAKSDFLATMSHEIRTPMNAIVGMAELLDETPLNQEQKEYIARLRRGSETLLKIINDILDLSKIESGSMEIENIDFDFYENVEKTVELVALKAHQKGLEMNVQIDRKIPQDLKGDPTRLRQILMNLINNAIKFTAKGEIALVINLEEPDSRLSQDAVKIHFLVRDTGIGISKEQTVKLFEPFTQADSSTTRKYGGTGLGLNICRRLVTMMNGRIWIESELEQGSQFHFILPMGIAQSKTQTETSAPCLIDKRVLVVDDNDTNRLILKRALEGWSVQTDEASSGKECLEKLVCKQTKPYDLIILDCRMPSMGGFDVARKIKESNLPSAPMILMLTSDNRGGDKAVARELGFEAYLIKPIKKDELKEALLRIFEKKSVQNLQFFASSTAALSQAPVQKGLKILIVDDAEDNRELLRAYFKKMPYELEFAENGKIAIDKIKNKIFDLVLMDMQMPEMDGYTATRLIREEESKAVGSGIKKPRISIVALTANALKEDAQKCFDAGCDYYLSKPVKKIPLLEMIQIATAAN